MKFNLQFFGWDDINTEGEGKKSEFTKFEPGKAVTLRVLDAEPYSRWTHWINNAKRSITCLRKDCPICSIIKEQKANNETAQYTSQKKHSMKVWNYDTQRIEILEQGNEFFNTLLGIYKLAGDLRGYDVKILRSGKTAKDTTYTILPQAPSPVAEDILKVAQEDDVVFADYYKAPTREQAIMILEGKKWDEIFKQDEESVVTETKSDEEVSFVTE